MLVCDECRKSSEEVPLAVMGIVWTGEPRHVVFSVLCQKCDMGEDTAEMRMAKVETEKINKEETK